MPTKRRPTDIARTNAEPNQWAILSLLSVAQLMVVLDQTIVNIALPSAQRALHFSADNRQWVVTAYALAFGSLLLLGGKLGDLFGRKWTFIAGLVGFAVASAIGGLAQSFGMLIAARALQGAFGALLAPAALSLLAVTFADSPDRPKAFGIFSGIAAGGGSVGLLLGGALTQAVSWRWCLYVNLIIAVPTAVLSVRLLVNQGHPNRPPIDIPGALTITGALFALVYGISYAETHSWSTPLTVIMLAVGAMLIIIFVFIERVTTEPLLPLHVVLNRARGGAYATLALAGSGIFSVFLFLTFYIQQNLGFSALSTGLAFLPLTVAIVITATVVQTKVLLTIGARTVVIAGMILAIVAMVLFTQLTPGGSYFSQVLPGLVIIGIGMGCVFAPAISAATYGVGPQEAGVASAMVNVSQQVGGSVGTALLSTLFADAAAGYVSSHSHVRGISSIAAVHGYTASFWWAAAIFGLGLLVAIFVVPGNLDADSTPPKISVAQKDLA